MLCIRCWQRCRGRSLRRARNENDRKETMRHKRPRRATVAEGMSGHQKSKHVGTHKTVTAKRTLTACPQAPVVKRKLHGSEPTCRSRSTRVRAGELNSCVSQTRSCRMCVQNKSGVFAHAFTFHDIGTTRSVSSLCEMASSMLGCHRREVI